MKTDKCILSFVEICFAYLICLFLLLLHTAFPPLESELKKKHFNTYEYLLGTVHISETNFRKFVSEILCVPIVSHLILIHIYSFFRVFELKKTKNCWLLGLSCA